MKRIARYIIPFAISALLLISCFALAGCNGPTKLVALTFEDGPSSYTEELLDGLEERGAYATFFMTGENADNDSAGIKNRSKSLLTRMWREGHQLANHSYSHVTLGDLSDSEIWSEVDKVENLIFESTGGEFHYVMRTPDGIDTQHLRENIDAPQILWSVEINDGQASSAEEVASRIISSAHHGDIVRLHDVYESSVDGVLQAIDTMQAQGYEFVTVAELMRRTGTMMSNNSSITRARTFSQPRLAYAAPEIDFSELDGYTYAHLSHRIDDITLYYTLNGSYPDLSSAQYEKPVQLRKGNVLTVVGVDEWGTRTPVLKYEVK